MYPTNDGLERIAQIDKGEMYGWAITEVWRNPDTDQYYIYRGAGCSCNYAYDHYEGIADLDGPYPTFTQMLAVIHNVDLIERLLRWEREEKR